MIKGNNKPYLSIWRSIVQNTTQSYLERIMNERLTERKQRLNYLLDEKRMSVVSLKSFNNNQSLVLYYTDKQETSYLSEAKINIEKCSLCFGIVISIQDCIFCINNCFDFKLSKKLFVNGYTVSSLMHDFKNLLSFHSKCQSHIDFMMFQGKIMFYCDNCLYDEIRIQMHKK